MTNDSFSARKVKASYLCLRKSLALKDYTQGLTMSLMYWKGQQVDARKRFNSNAA